MLTLKNNTYELLLQTAQTLVQTKSYSGFSFEELAQTVGIRKASVYYHFASKEALGIALIARAQEQIIALHQKNQHLTGIEQLHAFLTEIGSRIGVGQRICPGGALTANWDALPANLKNSVLRMRDTYLQLFTAMASAGRKDNSLFIRGTSTDEAIAKSIIASFQGGIILARLSGNKADYDAVIESLITSLSEEPSHA